METFKFIKGKYTNEKVVADSGVIKAVLSNGTDVTNSVNDETFQTAALTSGNVSDKEVKVYTLRESLSNIKPIGEVTDNNSVTISSLDVAKSPSGVDLPAGAATELSRTKATATLPEGISWNISSGEKTTKVDVKVGEATEPKTAKFTISGTVTVKKFVKASGKLTDTPVYTEATLATAGSTGNGYYNSGRKCVAVEAYETKEQEIRTPSNLGGGKYYNLVVNNESNWKLGINHDESIGSTLDGTRLKSSFNIKDVDFNKTTGNIQVSAWQKNADESYTKISEVIVVCDPTVYYQGLRLPKGNCFDINGKELNTESDLTSINKVYKEKCNIVSGDIPYKNDSTDENTYYTYNSSETVKSSSKNCNINNNRLTPNQTPFIKDNDDSSIYLNEKVEDVKRTVKFQ